MPIKAPAPRRGTTTRFRLGAGLAILLLATACTTPPQARAPAGAAVHSRTLDALDLAVVSEDGRLGTLVGTLVNKTETPDALIDVTVKSSRGTTRAALLEGPVSLPAGKRVNLSVPPRIAVSGNLPQGRFVTTTLTFRKSAALSTPTPVQPRTRQHRDVVIPQPRESTVG